MTTATLSQDERDLLHQAHLLKTLIETPSWKAYVEMLQTRVDYEASTALSRTEGIDQIFAKEFAKGTFAGLRLAMTLPTITIGTAQDIRARHNMDVGKGNGKTIGPKDADEGPDDAPSHPIGQAP